MENSAGIPIVKPLAVHAKQVFNLKALLAHGSPVITPHGFQKSNPYVMITGDDIPEYYQGLLIHYNPPNGSFLSAAKSGLVASEFNHEEVIRKEILSRASKLISEYLKNMKYPPVDNWMQSMSRQDKKKMRTHRHMWPTVMAELLEVHKQIEDARNVQWDDEYCSEGEVEDNLYDSEYLQEEEYIRKTIGPKSWWAKKYELVPRPHHQRQSKKVMSKKLFDARKSHVKYESVSQENYDYHEQIIKEELCDIMIYYYYSESDDSDYDFY